MTDYNIKFNIKSYDKKIYKVREYKYSLEQFSKSNKGTKIEKIIREKVNFSLGNF